jgi:hypothetical protein
VHSFPDVALKRVLHAKRASVTSTDRSEPELAAAKNVPQMERPGNHEFLKLGRHSSEFVSVRNRDGARRPHNWVLCWHPQKTFGFLRRGPGSWSSSSKSAAI